MAFWMSKKKEPKNPPAAVAAPKEENVGGDGIVRIVVGGQLAKEQIVAAVKECGGDRVQVQQKDDITAASDIQSGKADYYFGACQTGGGGSLGMAIAMCGYGRCVTVASPGKCMSEEEMISQVKSGKKCFGMVVESIPTAVPVLVKAMLE